MVGRGLDLEKVTSDGRGGVILWMRDGGALRPCGVPTPVMGALASEIIRAQTSTGDLTVFQTEKLDLRPSETDEPPALWLQPKGYPPVAYLLSWKQVSWLIEALAETIRGSKPPSGRPS